MLTLSAPGRMAQDAWLIRGALAHGTDVHRLRSAVLDGRLRFSLGLPAGEPDETGTLRVLVACASALGPDLDRPLHGVDRVRPTSAGRAAAPALCASLEEVLDLSPCPLERPLLVQGMVPGHLQALLFLGLVAPCEPLTGSEAPEVQVVDSDPEDSDPEDSAPEDSEAPRLEIEDEPDDGLAIQDLDDDDALTALDSSPHRPVDALVIREQPTASAFQQHHHGLFQLLDSGETEDVPTEEYPKPALDPARAQRKRLDLVAEARDHQQQGDSDAAARSLEQALELAPGDPQLLAQLAGVLVTQPDPHQQRRARSLVDQALEQAGDDPAVELLCREVRWRLGEGGAAT